MKTWNLYCECECMFAVVFAETLEEAIDKAKKAGKTHTEWHGEEWTENTYNGVLIFS